MSKTGKSFFVAAFLLAQFAAAFAAQSKDFSQITVQTQDFALVFSGAEGERLNQIYCGEKLADDGEYKIAGDEHQAYIAAGMDDLFEPAIRIIHADGNPSLELRCKHWTSSTEAGVCKTVITMADPEYAVEVELHFQAYYAENTVKAWTVITNGETDRITLARYASGMLHFTAKSYWLTEFYGDWANEMHTEEIKLPNGITTIDSKLGTRSTMYRSPFFFLSQNAPAEEASGRVLAGTIAWSGSFELKFEVDRLGSLRVIAGINPYASEYMLDSGKSFTTPEFIYTYSNSGKGQASRNLHRWVRKYGLVDGNGKRLTLLNNWEATYFDFDEEKIVSLFDGAKQLGVDMFLLDDGWFANKYPRNSDTAGLGDWQENKAKLPHGIGYLVKNAEEKGIKFGIWLEPEMVNPKSELYEEHPDWIIKLPNREENYFRNQLVLDLSNPSVQRFVYETVDDLMTKHPQIAFIKWDCNRMMTNTWSPYLGEDQSHIQIDYVNGLYKVLEELREKYPSLPIMLCSGGGGRTDYGAMKYFTEFWPSDNTSGLDRVYIQWNYASFFPAVSMCNHVTSWGAKTQSLKFRTDVAMMGKLGYDIRVDELDEDELNFSRQAIANYNRLSEVIWRGELYKLVSPYESTRAVLMYVSEDKEKALLFAYTLNARQFDKFEPVRLQGLDSAKKYKVEEINFYPGVWPVLKESGKTISGDYLMKVGLNCSSTEQLSSCVVEITAQ
ncbi:MAG: alpha-galactosidase [Phycisphaerae bacterium]